MKYVKLFEDFINEEKTLPLKSLTWDCWNQSIAKIFKDRDKEFDTYIASVEDDIQSIIRDKELDREKILSFLRKFWNEAISKKYVDMHINQNRFEKFEKKTKLI